MWVTEAETVDTLVVEDFEETIGKDLDSVELDVEVVEASHVGFRAENREFLEELGKIEREVVLSILDDDPIEACLVLNLNSRRYQSTLLHQLLRFLVLISHDKSGDEEEEVH
ncbi:hypothetical protein GCK72_008802 [Caenorhabditis remanei]|uniref:Uncharacterized protein n=1 Tax=Caenorhabditis remanei TaxID=31234 RepID=A0A6A5H1U6_CAERE|nr:hypothetical protein GCK72_008802 [Caenorhabditis remanei]KAF1760553.1 hypothetical protein GCK72_008802 [Caenorhabditis remanei]